MEGDNVLQVNVCDGVAADDDERLVEVLFGVLDTSRRAQRRLFNGIVDLHTQGVPVAKVALNRLGHEVESDHDLGDALSFEKVQDVTHDWFRDHGHHRFRPADGQGAQPRALTSGHHDRFHRPSPFCDRPGQNLITVEAA